MDNIFTLHLARLSLMLADHVYSSQPAYSGWQDDAIQAWANTHHGTELNQKLDEHNVGVAHHALLMGRSLPALRRSLPAIARHKTFRERAKEERFHWQNKAWDVASSLREKSAEQGFFGINMASTGCGKTFANARIMYALADEQAGCRFSVALGLRTLTLQTGQALQSRLRLDDDTLAVVTGAAAVKELYQGMTPKIPAVPATKRSSPAITTCITKGQPVAGSLSSGWRKNRRSIAWSVLRCW